MNVISLGNSLKLDSLLKKFGKNADTSVCAKNDTQAFPMLHWAALQDKVEILTYLAENLPKTVTVDQRNIREETALHWACLRGNSQAVFFLLSNNADVTAIDNRGYTPLHHAAQFGHNKIIAQLLRFMGKRNLVNIDCRDSRGRTPLHWAAYKHFPDTVRFLVGKGADVFSKDFEDLSPLHWGALQGDVDVVQAVLWEVKSPSKMLQLIDMKENKGQTAYQLADAKGEKFNAQSAEGYRFKHVKNALLKAVKTCKSNKLPKRGFAGVGRSENAVYDENFYHPSLAVWPFIGIVYAYFYFFTMLPTLYIYIPTWFIAAVVTWLLIWFFFLRLQVKDPGFIVLQEVNQLSKKNTFLHYFLRCYQPRGFIEKMQKKDMEENVHLLEQGMSLNRQYEEIFPPATVPNPQVNLSKYYREIYYEVLDKGYDIPICTTCEIARPLRSKHDRFTDRCVLKFDHYCPWVGTAVGAKNYNDFFMFCLTILILSPIWFINWYYYLKYYDTNKTIFQNVSSIEMLPWFVATVLPIMLFMVYAAIMVGQHSFLISQNMTTNEAINRYRYPYFKIVNGAAVNQFSRGVLKNWMEFLGILEEKKIGLRNFYLSHIEGSNKVSSSYEKMENSREVLSRLR